MSKTKKHSKTSSSTDNADTRLLIENYDDDQDDELSVVPVYPEIETDLRSDLFPSKSAVHTKYSLKKIFHKAGVKKVKGKRSTLTEGVKIYKQENLHVELDRRKFLSSKNFIDARNVDVKVDAGPAIVTLGMRHQNGEPADFSFVLEFDENKKLKNISPSINVRFEKDSNIAYVRIEGKYYSLPISASKYRMYQKELGLSRTRNIEPAGKEVASVTSFPHSSLKPLTQDISPKYISAKGQTTRISKREEHKLLSSELKTQSSEVGVKHIIDESKQPTPSAKPNRGVKKSIVAYTPSIVSPPVLSSISPLSMEQIAPPLKPASLSNVSRVVAPVITPVERSLTPVVIPARRIKEAHNTTYTSPPSPEGKKVVMKGKGIVATMIPKFERPGIKPPVMQHHSMPTIQESLKKTTPKQSRLLPSGPYNDGGFIIDSRESTFRVPTSREVRIEATKISEAIPKSSIHTEIDSSADIVAVPSEFIAEHAPSPNLSVDFADVLKMAKHRRSKKLKMDAARAAESVVKAAKVKKVTEKKVAIPVARDNISATDTPRIERVITRITDKKVTWQSPPPSEVRFSDRPKAPLVDVRSIDTAVPPKSTRMTAPFNTAVTVMNPASIIKKENKKAILSARTVPAPSTRSFHHLEEGGVVSTNFPRIIGTQRPYSISSLAQTKLDVSTRNPAAGVKKQSKKEIIPTETPKVPLPTREEEPVFSSFRRTGIKEASELSGSLVDKRKIFTPLTSRTVDNPKQ